MNVQEIIAKNGTDIGGFIDDMKKGPVNIRAEYTGV